MKLFETGDIRIIIHPLAILMCITASVAGYADTVLSYIMALIIHESAHVLASHCVNVKMSLIEITPFGGIASVESYYYLKPSHQIILAAAGPISNALVCVLMINLFYMQIVSPFLILLFKANLALLFFNIMPILPMDGGRMVHAIISQKINWKRSASVLCAFGTLTGVGFLLVAAWGIFKLKTLNLSMVLTGCYLIYAAGRSKKTAITECLHGIISARSKLERNGVLEMTLVAASGKLTVSELMMRVPIGSQLRIVVIDDQTLNEIGEIKQEDFEKAIIDNPGVSIASLIA